MKSFFGPVAACLCVAILFLVVQTPQRSQLTADDIQQKKAEIDKVQTALSQLVEISVGQNEINHSTRNQLASLTDAIKMIGDNMVDRKSVVKLVSDAVAESKPKAEIDECNCNCADLQKQLDELKARVAALEAKPAYSTGSYGNASPGPVKSGGSTGSMSSGGSTGSVKASGGSTGSVSYSSSTPGRWHNHDGLSREDHAAVYHGLNTAGMTPEQISAQLDADHDRFGPMHDQIIASRTRSVTRAVSGPVRLQGPASPVSNCPGGVCPTGPSVSRGGGGLLGFGLFRGRR